jgi:hypothetical protein
MTKLSAGLAFQGKTIEERKKEEDRSWWGGWLR